jgi:hypothetical protein
MLLEFIFLGYCFSTICCSFCSSAAFVLVGKLAQSFKSSTGLSFHLNVVRVLVLGMK